MNENIFNNLSTEELADSLDMKYNNSGGYSNKLRDLHRRIIFNGLK